jgi:O-antigen ligase
VRSTPWLTCTLLALLGLMFLSAQLNEGIDAGRRLLHLGLYVALALTAAQGRFHTRSMAKGFAVGLLVSAAAYFVGYGDTYEGRLAGLMADPNAAGYMLTTLGCLALAGLPGSRFRVPLGLLLLVAVVLTFSRTSLLAVALIVVWVIIGRLLAVSLGALLLTAMIWAVTNIPVSLQTLGPFSDRTGSDALRRRIVRLEELQISEAPWYGHGPGTSWVDVQGDLFFFHNSYLAILNEGGRLAQVLIVLAGALALVSLLRLRPELRNPWYEAALIAVAVCAANLGEVFLELPAALALGMAAYYARSIREAPPDVGATPSTLDSLESVRLR